MRFKIIVLVVVSFMSITVSKGQFNVGTQGSILYGFNNHNWGHVGGSIIGEISLFKEVAVTVGASYFYKARYKTREFSQALLPTTVPQSVEYSVRNDLTLYQFYGGAKYYLLGTHYTFKTESPLGIFVTGELGVLVGGMKALVDDKVVASKIDFLAYETPVVNASLQAFTDVNLIGGIGIDKMFKRFYLYYVLKLSGRVFRATDTGSVIKMPVYITSNLGFRIPFGDL